MGNLNETEKWEENIYQLETSDPVLGGADGISNRAPATGKQDEMAEEENGGSRTVTG